MAANRPSWAEEEVNLGSIKLDPNGLPSGDLSALNSTQLQLLQTLLSEKDRTKAIEVARGMESEMQQRKEECEKQLAELDLMLQHLNEVIAELQKQMEEVTAKAEELRQRIKELQEQKEALEALKAIHEATKVQLTAELGVLKTRQEAADREHAEAKASEEAALVELRSAEERVRVLDERHGQLTEDDTVVQQQVNEADRTNREAAESERYASAVKESADAEVRDATIAEAHQQDACDWSSQAESVAKLEESRSKAEQKEADRKEKDSEHEKTLANRALDVAKKALAIAMKLEAAAALAVKMLEKALLGAKATPPPVGPGLVAAITAALGIARMVHAAASAVTKVLGGVVEFCSAVVTACNAAIEVAQALKSKTTDALTTATQKRTAAQADSQRNQATLTQLSEVRGTAETRRDQAGTRLRNARTDSAVASAALDARKVQKKDVEASLAAAMGELEQASETHRAAAARFEITHNAAESARARVLDAKTRLKETESALHQNQLTLDETEVLLKSYSEEVTRNKQKRADLLTQLGALTSERDTLLAQRDQLQSKVASLNANSTWATERREKLERTSSDAFSFEQSVSSTLETLEELLEDSVLPA